MLYYEHFYEELLNRPDVFPVWEYLETMFHGKKVMEIGVIEFWLCWTRVPLPPLYGQPAFYVLTADHQEHMFFPCKYPHEPEYRRGSKGVVWL